MISFLVASQYTIDDIVVSRINEHTIDVKFVIGYPDKIRNSKKALKNLLKASSELRTILIGAVRDEVLHSTPNHRNRHSYVGCTVLGKECTLHIVMGQDMMDQPIDVFLDEILRQIYA